MITTPPVGSTVKLIRGIRYSPHVGAQGVVTEHQTKRVVTVRWSEGHPHAGAHETVRIDRLEVVAPHEGGQVEYNVIWTMMIDADSPVDAAQQALGIHRDPESIATVFFVESEGAPTVRVDLNNDGTVEEVKQL